MHMDISQGQLYAKIYTTAKMPCNSKATTTLCEPETLNQISQELFYERIYRINAAPQDLENTAPQTLPMDISQEQFRARICRKNAGAQRAYPDP
jgi:hypothetical protein